MNSAIRPTQSYMTSRSTAITQSFWFFPLKSILLKAFPTRVRWKNSAQCCFIYNTNEKTQSHRSCDVQQESAFTSPGPGDNRRSKSFFITVTPLFCSTTSAICSSPAAYQNCRALSGIYRWFTTVVCLNILSRTPLTSFTLKSLPFSDKSMGQPGSAGNFTLTHDTRVSVGWCIMHNFRLCICANTCIVLCTHNVLFQKVLDQQALVPKPYAFTFHLKSFENTAIPSAELFSHFWLHLLVLCVRRRKKSPETSFGSRQKKKKSIWAVIKFHKKITHIT